MKILLISIIKDSKEQELQFLSHNSDSYKSCGHLYITHVEGATFEQRGEIIVKMAERGISCNVHYKPLPLLTAYKS